MNHLVRRRNFPSFEEARKRMRNNANQTHAEQAIFGNILEQRRIVKDAGSLSKQRRRQEKTPPDSLIIRSTVDQGQKTNVGTSELKPYPVEIWKEE